MSYSRSYNPDYDRGRFSGYGHDTRPKGTIECKKWSNGKYCSQFEMGTCAFAHGKTICDSFYNHRLSPDPDKLHCDYKTAVHKGYYTQKNNYFETRTNRSWPTDYYQPEEEVRPSSEEERYKRDQDLRDRLMKGQMTKLEESNKELLVEICKKELKIAKFKSKIISKEKEVFSVKKKWEYMESFTGGYIHATESSPFVSEMNVEELSGFYEANGDQDYINGYNQTYTE